MARANIFKAIYVKQRMAKYIFTELSQLLFYDFHSYVSMKFLNYKIISQKPIECGFNGKLYDATL